MKRNILLMLVFIGGVISQTSTDSPPSSYDSSSQYQGNESSLNSGYNPTSVTDGNYTSYFASENSGLVNVTTPQEYGNEPTGDSVNNTNSTNYSETTIPTTGDTTTASTATTWPVEGCPSGWIDSVEGCFLFHYNKSLTWAESQLECEQMGGFLAEPKTEGKTSLLTSLAVLLETLLGVKSWWLGITDRGHEGRWTLQHSVEDVSYSNWIPGAPNGSEIDQDCGIMKAEDQFKWSDQNCLHATSSPICQRKMGDVSTSDSTATPTTTITMSTTTSSPYSPYHVELWGGNRNSSGNIFAVNSDGYFGPVCKSSSYGYWGSSWGSTESRVVCKQLGFSSGFTYWRSIEVPSTVTFAMLDVSCTGNEDHIQDCTYQTSGNCYDHGDGPTAISVYCRNY